MNFQVETAGESHGPAMLALVQGVPAGFPFPEQAINQMLKRRQGGVGRGGRQKIENDLVHVLSGVRQGVCLGSPLGLQLINQDCRIDEISPQSVPRPGHADYAGMRRYQTDDLHNIAERASARETAARVMGGAVAKSILESLGLSVRAFVSALGGFAMDQKTVLEQSFAVDAVENSPVYCPDASLSEAMVTLIGETKLKKDTLGGVVTVHVDQCPVGLGSHQRAATKLDACLAGALMSVQACKGVSIGLGFGAAALAGSESLDPFTLEDGCISRLSNHMGGIEGGMSNGQKIVVQAVMKALPTLMDPLPSVDLRNHSEQKATVIRADVTAVPAFSVVAEAVVATVICDALHQRLGAPSWKEYQSRFKELVEI